LTAYAILLGMKKGPGRPRKEKTEVVYVRLPETVAKAVREKAKREHRELSVTIGLILEEHLLEAVAQ
jgi:hypothetical protein